MSRYLITQSLISSWNYMHSCFESCQESAYNDFLDALNRIPKQTTPEMQNGIDFENEVYKVASGGKVSITKWENGINAVATIVKGSPAQIKVSREFTIGSMDFLAYGILDSLKAGTIYDVKFINKDFGRSDVELAGKYLDSPQHPAYLFMVPEAENFTYLVSDGEDFYTETYTRANTRSFLDIVKEFVDSLEAMGLIDVYKEKWVSK